MKKPINNVVSTITIDPLQGTLTLTDVLDEVLSSFRVDPSGLTLSLMRFTPRPKVKVAVRDLSYYNQLLKNRPTPEAPKDGV